RRQGSCGRRRGEQADAQGVPGEGRPHRPHRHRRGRARLPGRGRRPRAAGDGGVVRQLPGSEMRTGVLIALGAVLALGPAVPAAEVETAHFHHVHLNVTDLARTIQFYASVFGATPTSYAGVSDALFTERSFILLTKVAAPPPS